MRVTTNHYNDNSGKVYVNSHAILPNSACKACDHGCNLQIQS